MKHRGKLQANIQLKHKTLQSVLGFSPRRLESLLNQTPIFSKIISVHISTHALQGTPTKCVVYVIFWSMCS